MPRKTLFALRDDRDGCVRIEPAKMAGDSNELCGAVVARTQVDILKSVPFVV